MSEGQATSEVLYKLDGRHPKRYSICGRSRDGSGPKRVALLIPSTMKFPSPSLRHISHSSPPFIRGCDVCFPVRQTYTSLVVNSHRRLRRLLLGPSKMKFALIQSFTCILSELRVSVHHQTWHESMQCTKFNIICSWLKTMNTRNAKYSLVQFIIPYTKTFLLKNFFLNSLV